jgi:phosphoribosylformylglycinamidine synthase
VGGSDEGLVHAVHDVSGGGLAVTLAEMAAAAGRGCVVEVTEPAELFTELPSRFVVATGDADALCARAAALGIPAVVLGRAGGDRVVLGGLVDLPLDAVAAAEEGNLAVALGEP